MIGCILFGHKWRFVRRIAEEEKIVNSDARYSRIWTEKYRDIYRCEYCRRVVKTLTNIRADNSRREKWEQRSRTLKDILK